MEEDALNNIETAELSPAPQIQAQARSKLPKKRRRVLPVEQPRRKRELSGASNRRVNAVKHPGALKDLSPGSNKFSVNGMNMISLALQPPNLLRAPSASMPPLQARAPIVENPLINTQAGAISLASLQPPLMTVPPLQPRPATTGSLDLMLPLQPKLLPGYNLQASYLSSTLSTVRPPDLKQDGDFKSDVEVVVDNQELELNSIRREDSGESSDMEKVVDVDSVEIYNCNISMINEAFNDIDNVSKDEINSNIVIPKTDTSLVNSSSDNSPNNNSY